MDVKITERGWAGHFCCSKSCLFRRNTLLEYGDKKWIVSTVGNMIDPLTGKLTTIGYERWYETMAFEATENEGYIEADVSKDKEIEKCKTYLSFALSVFESIRSCKYAPCGFCKHRNEDDTPFCGEGHKWEWEYADEVKNLIKGDT